MSGALGPRAATRTVWTGTANAPRHSVFRIPRSAVRSPAGRRCFVLVELIIALAILVLVLGCLYGVLSSTVESRNDAERKLRDVKLREGLVAILRRDLLGVCINKVGYESFSLTTATDGTPVISFVSSVPPTYAQFGARWHPLSVVTYSLSPNPSLPGYLVLVRSETELTTGQGQESSEPVYEYIIDCHASVTTKQGEHEEEWHQPTAPYSLALTMTLALDDPEKVAKPRTAEWKLLFPIPTAGVDPFVPPEEKTAEEAQGKDKSEEPAEED